MVDAIAETRPGREIRADAQKAATPAGQYTIAISEWRENSRAQLRDFCDVSIQSPAQTPIWVENWARNVNNDIICATICHDSLTNLVIALEIVRHNGLTIAQIPGGRHANGNFSPTMECVSGKLPSKVVEQLFAEIGKFREDIDLIRLQRLAHELEGHPNPLSSMATGESPNIALSMDISGGHEAALARVNGKRKRKKHREDTRKFEANGGFRVVRARSPGEIERLLEFFFVWKAKQFSKAGIANVFDDETIHSFFHSLFLEAASEKEPSFVLDGLEVNGNLVAVTGSSIVGSRTICDFAAMSDNLGFSASPGEFLFFENIAKACADGMSVYDFSVGDEYYKRRWCTIESTHFDISYPLSRKGRIAAAAASRISYLKKMAKRNENIWRLLKNLRTQLPGRS
jgi:CelD/BcsL family acetyltransferase involved in cellulose biosynthesis